MITDAGWLSAKSAAAYLDMGVRQFDQWARAKGVPCKWVGRQRRYNRAALDRVLNSTMQREPLKSL